MVEENNIKQLLSFISSVEENVEDVRASPYCCRPQSKKIIKTIS